MGACYALAYYELLKEKPNYRVSGTVLFEDDDPPGVESGGIQGITLKVGKTLGNEMQLLKSRNMMADVVRELALEISYQHVGKHKNTDLYTESPVRLNYTDNLESLAWKSMRVEIIDSTSFSLTIDEKEPVTYFYNDPFEINKIPFVMTYTGKPVTDLTRLINISILPRQHIAQQLANSIELSRIEGSDLLIFTIHQEVPQKGIDIINKLIEIFFRNSLNEKKKQASNTLMFIEERLKYVTDELFNVEKSLENYRVNNGINVGLSDNATQYMDRITTTDETILNLEIQKNDLNEVKNQLLKGSNEFGRILVGAGISSPALGTLIQNYNIAVAKRKELMVTHEEIHPNVVKMDAELTDLRSSVINGVSVANSSIDRRLRDLQVELVPLTRRMTEIPKNERELLQIMRQQQIKETLFLFLLERREETAISMAAQIGNAKIIDSPSPAGKIPSNSTRFYALAFVIGLTFPLGMIMVLEQFNDKIQSDQEVKNLSGISYLGSICRTSRSNKMVIKPESRSAIGEMFRVLRTNLGFSVAHTPNPVIMVSSAQPGDGKTFVCLNLGISLAISGKKVVMLEMDLRRPQMLEYIKEGNPSKGLTNFLIGKIPLKETIQKTAINRNLDFISSGPIPPNPSELLLLNRMKTLIDQLKEMYDFVLIDTPPLGLVTDALLINKFSTNSVMVVRQKKTRRKDLQLIQELVADKKLKKPGIVLNGTQPTGKRYGGGYYAEPTPSLWNRKKGRPKLEDAHA